MKTFRNVYTPSNLLYSFYWNSTQWLSKFFTVPLSCKNSGILKFCSVGSQICWWQQHICLLTSFYLRGKITYFGLKFIVCDHYFCSSLENSYHHLINNFLHNRMFEIVIINMAQFGQDKCLSARLYKWINSPFRESPWKYIASTNLPLLLYKIL